MISTYEQAKKDHGLHNYEVAIHLIENTEYFDWVITVSFYACLNILKYKIFPIDDYYGNTYDTFEKLAKTEHSNLNKHSALHTVVRFSPFTKSISSKFRELHSLSSASRYNEFSFNKEDAEEAVKLMKEIFKVADTGKPVKDKKKRPRI